MEEKDPPAVARDLHDGVLWRGEVGVEGRIGDAVVKVVVWKTSGRRLGDVLS